MKYCLVSHHGFDCGKDLDIEIEKTSSKLKEESHLKFVCWICPNTEDSFVNKAMEEILALNSMIASLNTPVEKEESNRDLHLKSVSFQMKKNVVNLVKLEKWDLDTAPSTTTKNVYYNKKNHCNNIEVIAIVYAKCCNKI